MLASLSTLSLERMAAAKLEPPNLPNYINPAGWVWWAATGRYGLADGRTANAHAQCMRAKKEIRGPLRQQAEGTNRHGHIKAMMP